MRNDWKEYVLVDCLEELIDYRGKTPKKSDAGILTLSAKSVKMGKIYYKLAYRISKSTYDKFMVRGFPKKGDILMTTEAPLGMVAKLDRDNISVAQRLLTLRGKNNLLDNDYLMYYLMSNRGQYELQSRASGTTVQGIKRTEFAKVKIPIPPLPEQKAIAQILNSLDDKIELNRQMNQTLEQMAQAMFKSWFVDFDPVFDNAIANNKAIPEELQAKAEKRRMLSLSKYGKIKKPLPKKIQELFPDEFEFTEEMGWIPKGWRVNSVNKLININPLVKLPKGDVAKFVPMQALPTSSFSITDIIEKEYSGGAKFQQGDILLARITPSLENGKTAIVDFLDKEEVGFGSTEFIVLRGEGYITTSYIACLARDENFRTHCIQSMVGSSGRQRVQNAAFSNYFVAVPSNKIFEKYNTLTEVNFSKITCNKNEVIELTKLRDTLLPKLISGELRLSDEIIKKANMPEALIEKEINNY